MSRAVMSQIASRHTPVELDISSAANEFTLDAKPVGPADKRPTAAKDPVKGGNLLLNRVEAAELTSVLIKLLPPPPAPLTRFKIKPDGETRFITRSESNE